MHERSRMPARPTLLAAIIRKIIRRKIVLKSAPLIKPAAK